MSKDCPWCGESIKAVAKKCRHCGEFLDGGARRRSAGNFADCPFCDGLGGATQVNFTWWGGLLGPRWFTHVKCVDCGKCFNGKTGQSNDTAIAIYVGVSVVICLAVFGLLAA